MSIHGEIRCVSTLKTLIKQMHPCKAHLECALGHDLTIFLLYMCAKRLSTMPELLRLYIRAG